MVWTVLFFSPSSSCKKESFKLCSSLAPALHYYWFLNTQMLTEHHSLFTTPAQLRPVTHYDHRRLTIRLKIFLYIFLALYSGLSCGFIIYFFCPPLTLLLQSSMVITRNKYFQVCTQNCEKRISVQSCCPSVRMEQLGPHWTDLHVTFSNTCR